MKDKSEDQRVRTLFNEKKDPTFGKLDFDTFVIRCKDCNRPLAIYGGNPQNDHDDNTYCIKHANQRGFLKK